MHRQMLVDQWMPQGGAAQLDPGMGRPRSADWPTAGAGISGCPAMFASL